MVQQTLGAAADRDRTLREDMEAVEMMWVRAICGPGMSAERANGEGRDVLHSAEPHKAPVKVLAMAEHGRGCCRCGWTGCQVPCRLSNRQGRGWVL